MSGSAEKVDVWMPLYIGDYLADTTRLSTEAHGAYLLLIMDYWRKGAPPDDDEVLAQITRTSRAVWKKLRKILSCFFQISDGVWRHSKIEKLKGQAADGRGKANEKAKAAALARWEKKRLADAAAAAGLDAPGIAPSIAQASLGSCPSPSASELTTFTAAAAVPGIPRDPEAASAPPLPAREEPKTEQSPAVVMTSTLRKMGVNVTSMNPILLAWVSSGVKLEQLVEAVGIARERKGATEKLAPGYVHAILGDILNPPAPGKTAAAVELKPWWLSVSGIEAKGAELGVAIDGDTFPFYKLRVYAAAGPGPWSELAARAGQPVEQGLKKAGVAVDVAAEREKMKKITRQSAVN